MIDISDIITTDGYLEFCQENNICYIKTDYFYTGKFNWRGEEHPTNINNVCVMGHSDYPVTDEIASKFEKVFCTNRLTNSPNIYGLPLGLTNDCDDSPLHNIYGNKDIVLEVMNQKVDKYNLLYMNFNISNYPIERQYVFNLFKNFNYIKIGSIENSIIGRRKFLKEIKSSKFVLCPRGNGIDTHRIWETLYMGSIPIVKYENTHSLFTDLPILFIKDWKEIDKNFLENKYYEYLNKDWNLDKLKISYWNKLINIYM
jgi:hypothetical protein